MASSSCDTREFDRAFAAGSDRRHASAAASAIFFSAFLIGSSIFLTWSRGMCPIFSQRAWMLANAFLADSMSSSFSASISRLRAIFFSRFALWLISISASSAFFAAKMASPSRPKLFPQRPLQLCRLYQQASIGSEASCIDRSAPAPLVTRALGTIDKRGFLSLCFLERTV